VTRSPEPPPTRGCKLPADETDCAADRDTGHGCPAGHAHGGGHPPRHGPDAWPDSGETHIIGILADFGEYLVDHPAPPWINGIADYGEGGASPGSEPTDTAIPLDGLNRSAYLGAAAMIAIMSESSQRTFQPPFKALADLVPYQYLRRDPYQPAESPRQGKPWNIGSSIPPYESLAGRQQVAGSSGAL